MKEYEELDKAEAEARKIEAERKIEEEKKKKQEEAEKAAKEKEKKEKAGYDTGITYKQLARTPDDYIGEKVKFTGKIIQVIEGDKAVALRVAINNNYDMIAYCMFDPKIISYHLLDNDKITLYGTSTGLYSYQSTGAGTITIPSILIEKLELHE